jgi:hypothetical protein
MEQQQEQRHHTLLRMVTSGLLWLSKEADYQPVETALNLLVLWWTVLFFLSRDLFAISRVYDVMAVLAQQPIWGMVAALIVCWHCFFGLVFAATGIASFGAGSHFIFAGLAAWALWRYAGRPHA